MKKFKKIVSVLMSACLVLVMSMGASCTRPAVPTPAGANEVTVPEFVDNLAVGVSIYNYVAGFVVPLLPADVKDKLCPYLSQLKTFWNLGVKGLGTVIENKGAKGTDDVTINLGSFNALVDEIFAKGILDIKYKVYFDGIQAVVKLAAATMLPKLKFVDGPPVDLSVLYITFECGATGNTLMHKVTADDVRAAVAKMKDIPPEVSKVLDVIK